ncbi:ABC-2 type transport system ATP-binding protein [Fontibacillus phaseoli]|uniref:ABC-2 type transport system ATP-binding protein n=1 Tax=Fontibacillus phaseoli TaxID=1416533 RepID=A0A369BDR1_9BACL|nr:ABC transporter ATP-binding protein [Fontibacillus phaseoli]RCX19700.1 ABC-2 type transport system ATP-binding protein [Fontibacillus phaseoli]
MNSILECSQIAKKFGRSEAIRNATTAFEEGAVHGLLGANGAGKTTLLHILSGLIYPSQGQVLYDGQQVHDNPAVTPNICLVKSDERSWADYKVKDLIKYCSLLLPYWDEKFAVELLRKFRLPGNKKYKHLSRGMQSMVGIVKGLASRAPLTLFDEPTLGLDADMRETFYELMISDCGERQRTMILSTHQIDESANLFQYITLLEQGVVTSHMDKDAFVEQAHYLQGDTSLLLALASDPRVLHEESLAGTTVLVWYGELENQVDLERRGIKIGPVPLQKLFVYLTRKGNLNSEEKYYGNFS